MRFGFWLYGGPDQLMPLTSGLAAAFAFLLIFWNKTLGFFARILNYFRRAPSQDSSGEPHSPDRQPHDQA
jgi:hypothetical protein